MALSINVRPAEIGLFHGKISRQTTISICGDLRQWPDGAIDTTPFITAQRL
jgi:hypothetical protein